MTENTENQPQLTDLVRDFMSEEQRQRAVEELQRKFEQRYDFLFHPVIEEEKNRQGALILSSLDYVSLNTKRSIAYNSGSLVVHLPYDPVVTHFEGVMDKDRDRSSNPIKYREDNGTLPRLKQGYSPKLGILLNRPLHLIRRNFVLKPDGQLQRGVEQIIVSLERGGAEIGEVWIGRKWRKHPSREGVISAGRELVLVA